MAKKKAAQATGEPAASGLGGGAPGGEGAGAVATAAAGRAAAGAPAGSLAESGGFAAEGDGGAGLPVVARLDAGAELPPAPGTAWPEGDEWGTDIDAAYLQSKYTLVSVAAKRARQLLEGSKRRVESLSEKPVTIALEELSQGKLIFERIRDGG